MKTKNWILKRFETEVEIISEEYLPFYKNYLQKNGVFVNDDFSKSESFIDWDKYENSFSFFYDYEDAEVIISSYMKYSPLNEKSFVTMDFGYNQPVIKIPIQVFINNWHEFVVGANYESTIVSDSGDLVIEFLRHGYILRSNFKIK